MTDLLGVWVRRFLMEHLVEERNLARNTQSSYRDTLVLLIPFVAEKLNQPVDELTVTGLAADQIRLFLAYLEQVRRCSITTRNQRLAAIHALARFVAEHSPEHIDWCNQIRSIPFKKTGSTLVPYLEKSEMDALLSAPDRTTLQGRRDHGLLLFLYNCGARATEAAQVLIGDLDFSSSSVKIHGKGGKQRRCPLWPSTMETLKPLLGRRSLTEHVFLNRCGRPITRFGIHTLVERYATTTTSRMPSLAAKRISPHTNRHTTATHLLHAGVDINTIRAWLGHVSINTTNIYAEIDLEMKAKALAKCEVVPQTQISPPWQTNPALMQFLRAL